MTQVPNVTIDARRMEPPEPFVATMDALEVLPKGQTLLLILDREPHPLYKVLTKQGFSYEAEFSPEGRFDIYIRHAA